MNVNISGGGGGGGGGLPASYAEALASALRSATFNPGIEALVASSRCTSRLVVGSIVNEDPGSGPLSIWCQFRLPASLAANAGVCGLSPSETHILSASGSDPNSIGLAIMSGDLNLVMGNSSVYTRYALGVASLVGQVVDVVVTRSGSTLAAYVNGTAVTLTAVNVNGGVAPSATIGGTWLHPVTALSATIANSNVPSASPVHRLVLYNRALSPTEAALVHVLGVDVADQWGSHAPLISATVLNGGFETAGAGGADVFADWQDIANGTSTVAQDTAVFFEGSASARLTTDSLASFAGVRAAIMAVGKRYRVRFAFRHNVPGTSINPQVTAGAQFPGLAGVAPDTWSVQTVEGVPTLTLLDFSRPFGVANANFWYDGIVVTRIGAIVDLQFDGTCGFQAADRANQLDATLFNGCAFTLPDAHSGFARWIAAAPAGERMGGSAQVIIPANCAISRIVVRNINIGDGRTFSLGSSATSLFDIVSAVPLNGNGSVNIIDPASSISTTGQLWISYTGTGSIEVSVFFQPI